MIHINVKYSFFFMAVYSMYIAAAHQRTITWEGGSMPIRQSLDADFIRQSPILDAFLNNPEYLIHGEVALSMGARTPYLRPEYMDFVQKLLLNRDGASILQFKDDARGLVDVLNLMHYLDVDEYLTGDGKIKLKPGSRLTAEELENFEKIKGDVKTLAVSVSPDVRRLLIAGLHNEELRNMFSMIFYNIPLPGTRISNILFSPDEKKILGQSWQQSMANDRLFIFDTDTNEAATILSGYLERDCNRNTLTNENGAAVVAANLDLDRQNIVKNVYTWTNANPVPRLLPIPGSYKPYIVRLSADALGKYQTILVVDKGKYTASDTILLLDEDGLITKERSFNNKKIENLAVHGNNIIVKQVTKISLWDAAKDTVQELSVPEGAIFTDYNQLSINNRGLIVACAHVGRARAIFAWEISDGGAKPLFIQPTESVTALAISPDSALIAIATHWNLATEGPGHILVLDAHSGKTLKEFTVGKKVTVDAITLNDQHEVTAILSGPEIQNNAVKIFPDI